ncbi:triose-phosphate isomerase [Sinanaerobacter chloroacetimidivorans]|jgi:triosephosphate isomerase|uniref:Triosephosphate isomerase n=1 Tax=Sinanaerobacter chloroacetimidivorans TaxID=2818044 RepID=A0A8J7W722_9FIRM|nr:triose-phosphate isomerase [Sinanaerobacter chloroacetimidivorans]MBR0600258.1 triose-phosphate isomerase [Sinanaerobacter chloroacetimidivorans]
MRKPFIAGNWKMFKTTKEAVAFADEFKKLYEQSDVLAGICAPYTQLAALVEAFKGTGIKVGAQNMHFEENGAYTGEVSADMLNEIGVEYCVIGHSERRQYFNETDETVNKKLHTAFKHNILPIVCVGEVLEERDAGKEFDVVKTQMVGALKDLTADQVASLVVAYEPVWAIGTGRTATPEQANEMCGYIRKVIEDIYGDEVSEKVIIQYGGSVKPNNATELMNMEEIDGALVGGASLVPQDFIQIVNF